jgi:hypothetical protein
MHEHDIRLGQRWVVSLKETDVSEVRTAAFSRAINTFHDSLPKITRNPVAWRAH